MRTIKKYRIPFPDGILEPKIESTAKIAASLRNTQLARSYRVVERMSNARGANSTKARFLSRYTLRSGLVPLAHRYDRTKFGDWVRKLIQDVFAEAAEYDEKRRIEKIKKVEERSRVASKPPTGEDSSDLREVFTDLRGHLRYKDTGLRVRPPASPAAPRKRDDFQAVYVDPWGHMRYADTDRLVQPVQVIPHSLPNTKPQPYDAHSSAALNPEINETINCRCVVQPVALPPTPKPGFEPKVDDEFSRAVFGHTEPAEGVANEGEASDPDNYPCDAPAQRSELAVRYPQYYKTVPDHVPRDEVDTYVVNAMFPLEDPTGTLLHARKKLLVPGVRSGGKNLRKDVTEARDSLNRWLALNPETKEV